MATLREDEFGIALYSRHPFYSAKTIAIGEAGVPTVVAELDLPRHRLLLVGTHPVPPGGAALSAYRNDQLRKLGEFLRGVEGPVLLLGDLNVTPWSVHFRRFAQAAGLRRASQGRGPQLTWPALPWPLSIPLDHALHRPEVCIVAKRIGNGVRSDHYPVIVDFQLRDG